MRRGVSRERRILALVAALGLLMFVGAAIVQLAPPNNAHASQLVGNAPFDAPTDTPTVGGVTDTPTPTATRTRRPTPTPTAATTATTTTTPTATTAPVNNGNGGGGAGTGGDTPNGPQPTKVVLSQPTIGASDGGPLGGINATSNGANGVLIASLFGCVTMILGILVAAVALSVLVRGGYGPFLRALALGKRASSQTKGSADAVLSNQTGKQRQAWNDDGWSAQGQSFARAREYDDELPRRGSGGMWQDGQDDDYASSQAWQQPNNRRPPSNPRTAPRTGRRSRADW